MASKSNGGEKTVEGIQKVVTSTWLRLNEIWATVGYDEDTLTRRRNTVAKHVTELLEEMKQEAEERLNEQQKKLDELMQEIVQLAKDLTMTEVPELEEASGKSLLDMEKVLQNIADLLRKRKAARMEKYNKINEQVIAVSEELGEKPFQIEFEGIPADSKVDQLQQHLGYLHHDKSKRLELYRKYKSSIIKLFELLEKSPSSDLEQLVCESDEISLSQPISSGGIKALSQTVLDKLNDIFTDMQDNLLANKEKGEQYWQKIRDLWSRLSADEEMILAFEQVHRPVSSGTWEGVFKPSVLKGLHKEWERLEEEKQQNMSLFIEQVRAELCDLWLSKCFMTSVQERFTEPNYGRVTSFTIGDFNSDVYTEDLLERHEAEVEFWREFVERNKKIIEGVTKRGHMFAQYKTLDQKSDDPSRLANRGGALLKEEKERKKLEKTIPKLESELKQLCDAFEEDEDAGHRMARFLVYGRTIQEMIEQDWEEFHEEKRIRKEAKKKPNEAGTTLMTTQLGNPGTRKRPHTPSSVQRGAVTPNKRNRTQLVTPGKTIQSPFAHPPPSSSKKPFGKAPRSATKSKHNKSNSSRYFRPNISARQAASRKALRKSMDKIRNGSSLMSSGSSSSSNGNKGSVSQRNFTISSLEQLDFSKVVRGPILEVIKDNQRTPKRSSSKDNFVHPSTSAAGGRTVKKTPSQPGPSVITRQASSGKIPLPTKLTGKEQVPPASKKKADTVVSPVASYSEFTDHLLCQSTLNSSAMVPIQSKAAPTTPTKSQPGMTLTSAKLPLFDNRF